MSDATGASAVTTEDGVEVEQFHDDEAYPVPALVFDLRSTREETVTVRLVERLPDHVDGNDIGFRVEHGGDHWDAVEGAIVFEHDLAPGEELRTVCGYRGEESNVLDILAAPTDLTVTPPTDDGAEDGSEQETVGGDDELSGHDLAPEDGEEDTPDADAASGVDTTGSSEGPLAADGSVATALAESIRDGEVPEEDLATLRTALVKADAREERADPAEADAPHVARIEHLEHRVSEFEAYTGALEEFLVKNGPAREVLEEATAAIEETDEELERIRESLSDTDSRLDDHADDIAAIETEVGDLDDDLVETVTDVERIESELSTLADRLDAVEERTDDLAEHVEATTDELRADIEARLETVERDIESRLEELEDGLEAREDDLRNDIETVETRLHDDIEEKLAEIGQWGEMLSSSLVAESGEEAEETDTDTAGGD